MKDAVLGLFMGVCLWILFEGEIHRFMMSFSDLSDRWRWTGRIGLILILLGLVGQFAHRHPPGDRLPAPEEAA